MYEETSHIFVARKIISKQQMFNKHDTLSSSFKKYSMELLFASNNAYKIKEINSLLPQGYILHGLREVGIEVEIPETGNSIKENSCLKAAYAYDFLKSKNQVMAAFADDSGLEVEALNGAPGVYSARYAGVPKNDEANNQKLLQALKTAVNRKAQFVTVITLIMNEDVFYFEGRIKGTIAFEARGGNGFGYDPLFIPQGFRSTFAELNPETKNAVSHRGIAVKKLAEFLSSLK